MRALPIESVVEVDHTVIVRNVPWFAYDALVVARGDAAGPRMTYLEGDLELMSPSREHEAIARMIDRLVQVYAEHLELPLNAYGSWTLRDPAAERGVEPDACYAFSTGDVALPDLAVEVRWTSPLVDKLAVYAGLGVPEVWVWRSGQIEVHLLRDGGYTRASDSAGLPGIDLARVASLASSHDQSAGVRAFRASLVGPSTT